MKNLFLWLGAGAVAFLLFRAWRAKQAQEESLRADRDAGELTPGSSDFLQGRPRVESSFNLPTVVAGLAPAARYAWDTVGDLYRENLSGENKD